MGRGLTLNSPTLNPQLNLIPVQKRVVNFGEEFVIGRVLSVAAAGPVQADPLVRWGGLPGRRSHTSKTPWALGLISTVRIGAGAGRKWVHTRPSGDTDRANTPIDGAQKRTQEGKEKREEAFRQGTAGPSRGRKARSGRDRKSTARARLRSTPLRCARPALTERKTWRTYYDPLDNPHRSCIGGQALNITYRKWAEMSGPDPITGANTKIKRTVPAPNDLYYDLRDKWGGAQHIPAVDGP